MLYAEMEKSPVEGDWSLTLMTWLSPGGVLTA
jgi:hypothetical protein